MTQIPAKGFTPAALDQEQLGQTAIVCSSIQEISDQFSGSID
jgi:hypothetical protein